MGEKELLKEISKLIHKTDGLEWRDDCIITPITKDLSLLYSIDRPERIFYSEDKDKDIRLYGRWSASVVANDVIACGTHPRGISFDIGASEFNNVDELKLWILGVLDVCDAYKMKYEGGNMGIGKGISGISWGIQQNNQIIRRKGAHDGDILIATANIGTGWALRLLESKRNNDDLFNLRGFDSYKSKPFVNIEAFSLIWNLNAITCGMDITDGIIEFGYEILEQSGLGVIFNYIQNRPFPINDIAERLSIPEAAFLFEPGYDTPFAHGWCIKEHLIDRVIDILEQNNIPYTILGRTSKDCNFVCVENQKIRKELPRYWDDVNKTRGSIEIWEENILPIIKELL